MEVLKIVEFTLVRRSENVLANRVENAGVESIQSLTDVVWEEMYECQLKEECRRLVERDYSMSGR